MAQTDRSDRSSMVTMAIEGNDGWVRDPYSVTNGAREWALRFPDLPFVADGREVSGFTRKGRGTTVFDLFRSVVSGGVCRTDFLSVKTDTIQPDGKLPSKLEVSTGNMSTIQAIISGVNGGASIPTLVWASKPDPFGGTEETGLGLFLDIAPVIRAGVCGIEGGPYAKGQAPECYLKWSSSRPCGGKNKAAQRADLEFPCVDEKGRKWIAPDKVCYPELIVNLSAMGIRRNDWVEMRLDDIPDVIESQPWDRITHGF